MLSRSSFQNSRGQLLRTVKVLPDDGHILAALNFHHGLGGYADRDLPLLTFLASQGIAAFCFDVHGHGNSEPLEPSERFQIRSFDHLLDDAVQHHNTIVLPTLEELGCPGVRLFCMGSSMGGLVTALLACDSRVERISGIVLHAAAIDAVRTAMMRFQEPFAHLVNAVAPTLRILPRTPDWKNLRKPEEVAARAKDTRLCNVRMPVCTACSMLDGFDRIAKRAHAVTVPVLALHGEADEVCSVLPVERFLQKVSSGDVTLKTFPQGLHDMLHDYERDAVLSALLDWLKQQK